MNYHEVRSLIFQNFFPHSVSVHSSERTNGSSASCPLLFGVQDASVYHPATGLGMGVQVTYPIERTLLTSGMVETGVQSVAKGQQRIETPHLAVKYQIPKGSTFWRS